MKLVKKINVELNRKGFPKEIDVVQYDTGLQLKCIVKDFDIPNGTTATLYAEKPSGKFVYQQKGIEISDNTIIVDLENQAITEHGKVWTQITLSNGTDTISTFEMLMKVQKSRKDSGAVESTTVIRAFDEAIEKAVAHINEARDAASKYISESVDQSLSIAGKAADAAAVGKKVTELNENITNQFDARFYADGTGENKCNPYTMTNGKIDIGTGFIDTTDTTCKTSDFIRIPDGETKVVASNGNNASISYQRISFYKSDKSFISCTYSGTVAVDVPSEAKYVRVSNAIDKEHYVGFNSDGTYGGFVPYVVGKLRDDRIPSGLVTDDEFELLKGDMNSRFPIHPDQTTFFTVEKSTNLLSSDVSEFSVGRLKDGNLDETQSTFLTSPMIVISGNDGKYVVVKTASNSKGTNAHAFYDVNGNYITGYNYSKLDGFILIPDNAFYFRFSGGTNLSVKYFVGINEEPSPDIPYEPYYYNTYLKDEYVDKNALDTSWYKGKKAFALGDSITANGSTYTASDGRTGSAWREFVATILKLSETVYNCGVGGSKVSGVNESNPAMWTDERINAIPTDCDFGFFNGGMNDWGGNVQLGDEDSTDTTTFYGALNVIAKKLTQRFPNHPIFWMSTTYGYKGERPDGKNSIGLTQYDYGRAIIKVAEKHGFIPIDLHALCGWNEYNISLFVNDESTTEFAGFIHPNRNGGKKMATAICSVVKAYQPCELE